MLPIIKSKIIPTIGVLHNLAMRHIFDKQSMSYADNALLEEGIDAWSKKVDITPSDRWEIKRIVNAIVADEKGHFNRAKELLIFHGRHYRDLYKNGLPYIDDPDKCRTFGRG